VLSLRKWKSEEYSIGRPKDGRHRAVTSKALQDAICTLLGFVVNILGEPASATLSELVQERIVGGFIEWSINIRKVKGRSLLRNLSLISAAMRQHPSYRSLDLRWFKILLDGLTLERSDALKKRKAVKYVAYDILDTIPAKIRAVPPAAEKKGKVYVARLAMEELLMRLLLTLPWRQRNIRECRSGGRMPNLFKATVPTFSGINKPAWVRKEEQKNPATEFWQFRFSAEETKTGNPVEALLPTQLIESVEEYLADFRPYLVRGDDPGTLFLNRKGTPLTLHQMTAIVSELNGTQPLQPDMILRRHIRPALEKIGVTKRIGFHSFRHGLAVMLRQQGVDLKTAQELLRHATSRITLEVYQQAVGEEKRVAQNLAFKVCLKEARLSTLQHPRRLHERQMSLAKTLYLLGLWRGRRGSNPRPLP
jgi:integrase